MAQLEKKNRYLINYPEKKGKPLTRKIVSSIFRWSIQTLRGGLVPSNFGIFFLLFSFGCYHFVCGVFVLFFYYRKSFSVGVLNL